MEENYCLFDKSDDELEYEAFVEKFKPKKTTDDCYTPAPVYAVVRDYCVERYDIKPKDIVRPFYPGGDYENYPYKKTDVVVDNPPFSILSQICRFYEKHGIRFFLFAPYLTNFSTGRSLQSTTHIVTEASIIYENRAVVATSFLTNLETEYICRSDAELNRRLNMAVQETKQTVTLPKYKYPAHIVTASMLGKMAKYGVSYGVRREEAAFVPSIDSQKAQGKSIFGGGYLISEKAAAEKAAAIEWELSERERAIIRELSGKQAESGTETEPLFAYLGI